MRAGDPTFPDAHEDQVPGGALEGEIQSLEEALTLAAAAPGRRRLERLEELLLLRAGQASLD
jgi:hypothetical protein